MTGPREWRHAEGCKLRYYDSSSGCSCGLSAVRDAIAAGHRVVIGPDGALAEPAPEPEEGWTAPGHEDCGPDCQAKQIVKMAANLSESERVGPVSTRDGAADPAPVGLTEAEVLHMTDLREAWRRAAPVYTDLAATDVEWLCTLIDRLSSPSVDPEEEP